MTDLLDRMWGANDLDALFGGQARVVAPWTRASRSKRVALFDRAAVSALLSRPATLREVDPRTLYANQPWILRQHVAYYRTDEWEQTGRTAADRYLELNQYPVVVKTHRDANMILAGHHRAAAALLEGRPLLVRVEATDQRCCITPRLGFDPRDVSRDPVGVAARITAGVAQSVRTLDVATAVLELIGLAPGEIDWCLAGVTLEPTGGTTAVTRHPDYQREE